MRLVDADKVMATLKQLRKDTNADAIKIETAMRIVSHAETKDAIPVSYIWQQINKEINEENRIAKKIGTLPTTTVSYAYSKLIEKWEKENDKGNAD